MLYFTVQDFNDMNLMNLMIFLGGAISVHDHSVLTSTSTNFTGNKAESLTHNQTDCPQGLYLF